MTFAHLSDTHLGYQSYGRNHASGVNQREVDVMKTFQACLGAIGERDPDVVVHSGDVFNSFRPSNHSVVAAFRAISAFQAKRGNKIFIIVGGNHDTPRATESGNILKLLSAIPGVIVFSDKAEAMAIEELDLEILAVPDNSIRIQEQIEYSPSLGKKHSLLVMHAVDVNLVRAGSGDLDIREARQDKWTYVALGDYHIAKDYGPNICYAGSTDFTSSNIWEEATIPKRWVWFDTSAGKLESVPLTARQVIDLPRIDALKLEPSQIDKRLQQGCDWDEASLPIVRQRVINASIGLRGKLDQAKIRDIQSRALFYRLDLIQPEPLPAGVEEAGKHSGKSVQQRWEEHVAAAQIPVDVDRKQVASLGIELMAEVEREADSNQA
jgi:exonuclease SbcD